MQSDIFVDILIFGLIALAVGFRLYRNLGKHTGHRKPYQETMIDKAVKQQKTRAQQKDATLAAKKALFEDSQQDNQQQEQVSNKIHAKTSVTPVGQKAVDALSDHEAFDVERFFEGAETAFHMIYRAFRSGDIKTLELLLGPRVLAVYSKVIEERDQNQERWEYIINNVDMITLLEGKVSKTQADLIVAFETTREESRFDASGKLIDGAPGESFRAKDIWTFRKKINDPDPTWLLVATKRK